MDVSTIEQNVEGNFSLEQLTKFGQIIGEVLFCTFSTSRFELNYYNVWDALSEGGDAHVYVGGFCWTILPQSWGGERREGKLK